MKATAPFWGLSSEAGSAARKVLVKHNVFLTTLMGLLLSAALSAQERAPIYKQASAPIPARVHDLLSRMTLEEKVAQLESQLMFQIPGAAGSHNAGGLIRSSKVDESVAKRWLSNGLGTFATIDFAMMNQPMQAATQRNLIQDWVQKNTRLGIPVLFHGEALHGAMVNGGTAFPVPIGIGSTWDRALVQQMFTTVALESRAAGTPLVLAPVLDQIRDPRYGRVEEMYSEDPYLVGELGVAAVEGLQGAGPLIDQDHVIATAKHFVHGQPENGTNIGPNDFSERTMRDVFLYPFERAVKIGHIGAVMPSYNENDGGLPSSANSWLLKDVLRREWGFSGLTVSDYLAVPELDTAHHIVANAQEAGVLAFNSGLDMELPFPMAFPALVEAVQSRKVRQQALDAAVARVLTAKFKAGLFEHPFTDPERAKRELGADAHAALARKVADEAIVLLKNDGKLLPLDEHNIKTLAVIGPNADTRRLGGYSSLPPHFVSVLDGIRQRLGGAVTVTHAQGCMISDPDMPGPFQSYSAPSQSKDETLIAAAVETARSADTVILILGGNETVSREAFGADGDRKPAYGDTDDLELPGRQNQLVSEILKLGKPTVAVLLNGRPYSVAQLASSVPAIVEGWYLGQETGGAVAGVLFGDVNPSGRLPVSIARNVGQLPVYYYKTPSARLGYVFGPNAPLFPFGFGLTYTSFTYGKPTLDRAQIAHNGTAKVSTTVTNSGSRAGDEVVQMYIHHQVSSVVQPVLRLRGFERIHLEPGQTKTVTFDIGPEQLSILNRQMQRVVEPGVVDVLIGPNSAETTGVPLGIAH